MIYLLMIKILTVMNILIQNTNKFYVKMDTIVILKQFFLYLLLDLLYEQYYIKKE